MNITMIYYACPFVFDLPDRCVAWPQRHLKLESHIAFQLKKWSHMDSNYMYINTRPCMYVYIYIWIYQLDLNRGRTKLSCRIWYRPSYFPCLGWDSDDSMNLDTLLSPRVQKRHGMKWLFWGWSVLDPGFVWFCMIPLEGGISHVHGWESSIRGSLKFTTDHRDNGWMMHQYWWP